jgi:DNA-binding MarR family transcriptional regulator
MRGEPRTARSAPAPRAAGETAVDFGPLADMVGFMVRLAQLRLFESFFDALGGEGVTPGQVGILVALGRNPGIRQGVLADALSIKWSNMAKIIRLLEADGLIRRSVPETDRRAVELHLTAKGAAAIERLLPKAMASDLGAAPDLTARERATLLKLLAKIASAPVIS